MRGGKVIWGVLGVCALLIAGAMGWFTWKMLELEKERALAEARADLEERTRLALWRMDTVGAAMVLGENRRLPEAFWNDDVVSLGNAFSPFLPSDDPLVKLHFELVGGGDLRSPEVDEQWSRQAGIDPELLKQRKQRFKKLRGLLRDFPLAGDEWSLLKQAADVGESAWAAVPKSAVAQLEQNKDAREQQGTAQVRRDMTYQQNFNDSERAQRAKAVGQAVANSAGQADPSFYRNRPQAQKLLEAETKKAEARAPKYANMGDKSFRLEMEEAEKPQASIQPTADFAAGAEATFAQPTLTAPPGSLSRAADADTWRVDELVTDPMAADEVSAEKEQPPIVLPVDALDVRPMRAVWIGGELFLLRLVTIAVPGGVVENRVQGAWLNAAEVKSQLLAEVADLLPLATLVPETGNGHLTGLAAQDPLALVAFPLRLQTNEQPRLMVAGVAPIQAPLMVGWVAVIFALAASALLVRGVMRLSERRAAFVSSVTHELRTPLTTFRLYSDMLAEGMVREEQKRGDYLRTMRSEADRLHHLVENVLAYSRIERGSARTRREQVALGDLLDRMRDRLAERVRQAGMEFEFVCGGDCREAPLETDVTAVEQIIFNLVDNACKYGRGADGGMIRVTGRADGRRASVSVRDDGPGVAAEEGKRLFRPFHKSATEAAHTQPGVGLGLALSRRLAKALGGGLKLANPGEPGAEFRLELPLG